MAVDSRSRSIGVGTRLWSELCSTTKIHDRVTLDVVCPYVLILGVDRQTYPGAWQWFLNKGCQPTRPGVSMVRNMADNRPLPTVSRPKAGFAVIGGGLPKIFRFHSLVVARVFGVGWERALRQTWIQDRRLERVLRLYTRTQVWGEALLGFILQYIRTGGVNTAYLLPCTEGTATFPLYRKQGFHVIRTFVSMVKQFRSS